jgi:hypothetical protein
MTARRFATGRQGSWFATVDQTDLELPVLKSEHWGDGATYHDPYPNYLATVQGRRYIEALRQGRALMAKYDGRKRVEYRPAIFNVANVTYSPDDGLRLVFTGSTSRHSQV